MSKAGSQLVQIEDQHGGSHWYLEGKRHREDGPAIVLANGSRHWFIPGLRHREDGPAIEWVGGTGSWWLMGGEYTPKTFEVALARLVRLRDKERKRAGSIRSAA